MHKFIDNFIYISKKIFNLLFKSTKWILIILALPIIAATYIYKKRLTKETVY